MKKCLSLSVTLILMILAVSAGAQSAADDLLSQLDGQVFEFSSGVGAWSTEMSFGENGAFTGNFHDSEMGETGEGYPNGSVYVCAFSGQLSNLKPVDEYTWTAEIRVDVEDCEPETIEDGIRYVSAAPYGLEDTSAVTIFLPGMPVDRLPEAFMFWSHLNEIAPDATEIPYFAIWNEKAEAGFITYPEIEPEVGPLSGGWTPAADPTVTDDLKALFDKGLNGLLGVNYAPVCYLGSQVVAGANHAFLCQATVVYPNAQPYFVIVYLYEDLQGNVSILNIADFDVGSLCTYGAE